MATRSGCLWKGQNGHGEIRKKPKRLFLRKAHSSTRYQVLADYGILI